jgi:hypothetical protein
LIGEHPAQARATLAHLLKRKVGSNNALPIIGDQSEA